MQESVKEAHAKPVPQRCNDLEFLAKSSLLIDAEALTNNLELLDIEVSSDMQIVGDC